MAVLFDCLIELQKQVQGLNLPGIPPGNVVLCQVPAVEIARMNSQNLPAIVIAPYGSETIMSGGNQRDDVTYPVLVAIVASTRIEDENVNQKQLADFEQRLGWREAIRRAFSNQRLTQELIYKIEIQSLPIVDAGAFQQRNLFVSGFVLRLTNRETRA